VQHREGVGHAQRQEFLPRALSPVRLGWPRTSSHHPRTTAKPESPRVPEGSKNWENGGYGKEEQVPPEVRGRAVHLVTETRESQEAEWAVITSVPEKIGCTPETLRKWLRQSQRDAGRAGADDGRQGAHQGARAEVHEPRRANEILKKAIVPKLAAEGIYVASGSTMYRLLASEQLLAHRGRSRPPTHHRPPELIATTVKTVCSCDITYLRAPVRGSFFYLYLIEDLYSRSIVGREVHEQEAAEAAGKLVDRACRERNVDSRRLHLYSDNGGPMKGATMPLQRLGVVPSFSRPRVSETTGTPKRSSKRRSTDQGFQTDPSVI
jgi:transposase InsO family protein